MLQTHLLITLILTTFSLFYGVRYNVVGHQDQIFPIQLKSQYDISPGSVLKLPIIINEQKLSINGKLPGRLLKISSPNEGLYGIGDIIYIDLEYTKSVQVYDQPSLIINTGCTSDYCILKEVQSFVCIADIGKFAIRFQNQFIMNINFNTTETQFKELLETLNGVYNVSVTFTINSTLSSLYSNRICSPKGTNVTIVYENVSFPLYNGNVPDLKFDVLNENVSLRTGISQGVLFDNKVTSLAGIKQSFIPEITYTVIQEGFQKSNSIAYYYSGNLTNIIRFKYVVEYGDTASNLNVVLISYLNGTIVNPGTYDIIYSTVPRFGAGDRYMFESVSSLSYNRNILLSTSQPYVVSLTSPNSDGTYTEGDKITIYLTFDLPIKIYYGEYIKLQLNTGAFDRFAIYQYLANHTTIVFLYTVQPYDTSTDLDVLHVNSLYLGIGSIYRDTLTNQTNASLILPYPGSVGSLSVNRSIVINTEAPIVESMYILNPEGVYTAGDYIDLILQFNQKVYVIGNPIVWIENIEKSLNAYIRTAPALPTFSFTSSTPGNSMKIYIYIDLNFQLVYGDYVSIHLPSFFISDTNTTILRYLYLSGDSSEYFNGYWDNNRHLMILTCSSLISSNSTLKLIIDGKSGIFSSKKGLIPSKSNIYYNIYSKNLNNSVSYNYTFGSVGSIGFKNLSISIYPRKFNHSLIVLFSYELSNTLVDGDQIIISFPQFISNTNSFDNLYIYDSMVSLSWSRNSSTMYVNILRNISVLSDIINVTEYVSMYLPINGVHENSFVVSAAMYNNGNIESLSIPYFTPICGFNFTNVRYSKALPGSESDIYIEISTTYNLISNDILVIILPESSSYNDYTVPSIYCNGLKCTYFTLSITDYSVYLYITSEISANTNISFVLSSSIGLTVPTTGISSNISYELKIISSLCVMDNYVSLPFEQIVTPIIDSNLVYYPLNLNSNMTIDMSFIISTKLLYKDIIYIYLRGFSYLSYLNKDNSVVEHLPHKLNISSFYNQRYERLIIHVLNDFNLNQLSTNITMKISNILSPSTSITSDQFTMSIYRDNSFILNSYILTSTCLGFCSSNVLFSTQFLDDNLTLTVRLSYSDVIYRSTYLQIHLTNFLLYENEINVSLYFMNLSYPSYYSKSVISNNIIKYDVPIDISASNLFSLQISGIRYVNTTSNLPNGLIIVYNNVFNSSIHFDLPIIYESIKLINPSIYFHRVNDSNVFNIEFRFGLDKVDLSSGYSLYIYLSNITVIDEISVFPNPYVNISSISFSDNCIAIIINETISAFTSGVSIYLKSFNLINYNNDDLFYSVNVNSSIVGSKEAITYVEKVYFIKDVNIALETADLHINKLDIAFYISNGLSKNDIINITIPYIRYISNIVIIHSTFSNFGKYIGASNTLSILVNSTYGFGYHYIKIVNYSSVTSYGIPNNSFGYISYGRASQTFVNTSFSLPCIGICYVAITPFTFKTNYAMTYEIFVHFSFINISFGDVISFYLHGFSSKNISTNIIYSYSSDRSVLFTWVSNITTLMIRPTKLFNASNYILSTVPIDLQIKTPTEGISNYQTFLISFMNANRTVHFINQSVVTIHPIGKFSNLSVIFDSSIPGEDTAIHVSFFLSNQLTKEDKVYLYLPGFNLPNETVLYTSEEYTVQSISQSITYVKNIDNTYSSTHHMAHLLFTFLKTILSNNLINLYVPSGLGIAINRIGVYSATIPKIAIDSYTCPIDTTTITNYTVIGSLYPFVLSFNLNDNLSINSIDLSFMIHCPLLKYDNISVYLPNVIAPNQYITSLSTISKYNESIFKLRWLNESKIILLSVSSLTYIKGNFSMSILLNDSRISNLAMIENDNRYTYSIKSAICSNDFTPISISPKTLISNSSMSFSTRRINSITGINLSFQLLINLHQNDKIVVHLPNFYMKDTSLNKQDKLNLSSNISSLHGYYYYKYSEYNPYIDLILYNDKFVKSTEYVYLTISSNNNITVPSSGVSLQNQTDFSINIYRYNESILSSYIYVIQSIGYFSSVSLNLNSGQANSAVDMKIIFQTKCLLSYDDVITIYLPGFTSSSSTLTPAGPFSDSVKLQWDANAFTLVITLLSTIPSDTIVDIIIITEDNLISPSQGISSDSDYCTISLNSNICSIFNQTIYNISIVPYISMSSIYFLSNEDRYSYIVPSEDIGFQNSIVLYPGHGLNDRDIGSIVSIADKLYTINDISDDVVYFNEEYNGTIIFLGEPRVSLHTSPVRPAYYQSGSYSSNLTFRYKVRRGDSSSNITLVNPYNSQFISNNIDLNGGKILRISQNPSLEISTSLYSYLNDQTRMINTDKPKIISIYTTSINGTYSWNELVDIHIVFSHPVKSNGSAPILLLNISLIGLGKAFYSSGMTTNELVYSYQVRYSDIHSNKLYDLIPNTTNHQSIFYQPIRVIPYSSFDYLRRLSDDPTIDANLLISRDLQISPGVYINGKAPNIERVYLSSDRDVYSAGDIMYVTIEYSESIYVTNTSSDLPYIVLDLGNNNKAYYYSYKNNTITFYYEISIYDTSKRGLYLKCTCQDYYNRTYIHLEQFKILSLYHIPVSILISANDSLESLLINSSFIIDNAQSVIESITTNISINDNILTIGRYIEISVQFNTKVYVFGLVALFVNGEMNNVALYLNGNGTNSLNFIYLTNQLSGVSRLDIIKLDYSQGNVKRLSDHPMIDVDFSLTYPGSPNSLGVSSDVTVDVSIISIETLYSIYQSNIPVLSLQSINLGIPFDCKLVISRREIQDSESLYLYSNYTSLRSYSSSSNISVLSDNFIDDVTITYLSYFSSNNLSNLVIESKYLQSFSFIPDIYLYPSDEHLVDIYQNSWLTNYEIASSIKFDLSFSSNVISNDKSVYLPLNSNKLLNKAFSTEVSNKITFIINMNNNNQLAQYLIHYNGKFSKCISLMASATGVDSILEGIETINELKILSPWVLDDYPYTNDSIRIVYITFIQSLSFPLSISNGTNICDNPVSVSDVTIKNSNNISFDYPIRALSSVILVVRRNLLPGTYVISLGVSLSVWGIQKDSFLLEHFNTHGNIASTSKFINEGIPKIIYSSLSFSAMAPNFKSLIYISICLESGWYKSDYVEVTLHQFEMSFLSNSLGNHSYISWFQSNFTLILHVYKRVDSCINEIVGNKNDVYLPSTGIYDGVSRLNEYTLITKNISLFKNKFDFIGSTGFKNISISFDNPRPGESTGMNITFDLLYPINSNSNTSIISIYLPEFYCFNGIVYSHACNLSLIGPYSTAFNIHWDNSSSSIFIKPKYNLQINLYSLQIPRTQSNNSNTLHFSKSGFSNSIPMVSVISKEWNMAFTYIKYYPKIMGIQSSLFNITVDEFSHVIEINLKVNFTRSVQGSAYISIYIPFFTTYLGIYSSNNTFNVLIQNYEWNDINNTLTLMVSNNFTETWLNFRLSNQSLQFYINSLGIPRQNNSGVTVSLYNNSDGFYIPSIPITTLNPIGVILNSSLVVRNSNVFTTSSININLLLNTYVYPDDQFIIYLYGYLPVNESYSNVTILGDCVGDSYVNFDRNYSVVIVYSDSLDCQNGSKSISWTIPKGRIPLGISQASSNSFQARWISNDGSFDTGYNDILNVPSIGILSSSLTFDWSYTLNLDIKSISLKIITSTDLYKGDKIILKLFGLVLNNSMNEISILDNFNRSWGFIILNQNNIYLTSPKYLYPTTLKFQFDGSIIKSYNNTSSYLMFPNSNITIALSHNNISLLPQTISFIQSIGYVKYINVQAIAQSKALSSTNTYRDVKFVVNLMTYHKLNVNDQIILYSQQYRYLFDTNLVIHSNNSFTGRVDSENMRLIITVTKELNSNEIFFSILPSESIILDFPSCDYMSQTCPMFISVISEISPISSHLVYPKCIDYLYQTSLGIETVEYLPTYSPTSNPTGRPSSSFPTNHPTGQPSCSPSSQPTSKPTRQPTSHPTLPSFYPTYSPSYSTHRRLSTTYSPSSQPTSQPTTQPTRQPTNHPSQQPTSQPTRQPSAQPSGQPTGLPTNQPTNSPTPYYVTLNLEFYLATTIDEYDKINIFLPKMIPNDIATDEPTITKYDTEISAYWSVYWFGFNQTLQLTALIAMPPGRQIFTIGSSEMLYNNEIIYENDTSFTYSLQDQYCNNLIADVSFDIVIPFGLIYSSLYYTNFGRNQTVGIIIEFSAVNILQPNDRVTVYLPGFAGLNGKVLNISSDILPDISNYIYAWWDSQLSSILFTIKKSINSLNVKVLENNEIKLSNYGSNNITGLPKISLHSDNWLSFAFTPLKKFTPVGFFAYSELLFSYPANAGDEADLHLVVSYPLGFTIYDQISIQLPAFWYTKEISLYPIYFSNYTLEWFQSNYTMNIYLQYNLTNVTDIMITIPSVHLPFNGVNDYFGNYIKISTNASNGVVQSSKFNKIQYVSSVKSYISFYPNELSSNISIYLSLLFTSAINVNETINISFPGLIGSIGLYNSSVNTRIEWIEETNVLSIKLLDLYNALTDLRIFINSSFQLPDIGYPLVNSPVKLTLDSIEGSIHSKIISVDSIGFVSSNNHIYYKIISVDDPVEIRFQVELSNGYFSRNDKIFIQTPIVTVLNNEIIYSQGDNYYSNYESYFNVTFDNATGIFCLMSNHDLSNRIFNIHLNRSNNMYINKEIFMNNHSMNHYIFGNITSIGNLSPRLINYSPSNIFKINPLEINFQNCSYQYNYNCNLSLSLFVSKELEVGEMIAISHRNLVASELNLEGNLSSFIFPYFRSSDNIDNLKIDRSIDELGVITQSNQSIYSNSDVPINPINLTLPYSIYDTTISSIHTNIPRILYLYSNSSINLLLCDDFTIINIVFSDSVMILLDSRTNSYPVIHLNTFSIANYLTGNNSNVIEFLYRVNQNHKSVSDLQVTGPNALIGCIVSSYNINLYANLTIPPPYGTMIKGLGLYSALSVNSNFSAYVERVYIYNPINRFMFGSGDIIDISVQFNRNIYVYGIPKLEIDIQSTNESMKSYAHFLNVSLVQWIDVSNYGFISILYENEYSDCIYWNDLTNLNNAISNIKSLSNALPVFITAYPLPYGLRYKLTFNGQIAPSLLSYKLLVCPYDASVNITIDSSMLSMVTFRFTLDNNIQYNKTFLRYKSEHSLIVEYYSNYIYLPGHEILPPQVSVLLPSPGTVNSLSNSSVVLSTSSPYIVSVYSNTTNKLIVTGDSIEIFVNFSSNIFVSGIPQLQLNLSTFITSNPLIDISNYLYNVSMLSYHDNIMIFRYVVNFGDYSKHLDYYDSKSLILSNNCNIYQYSLNPITLANLHLPYTGSIFSLSVSSISINASTHPIVVNVKPADSYIYDTTYRYYSNGDTTNFSFVFSYNVTVKHIKASEPIILQILTGNYNISGVYISGSTTTSVIFKVEINVPIESRFILFPTNETVFMYLINGYFNDRLGNEWTNISYFNRNESINLIYIDTYVPRALYVNISNFDDFYYPGQVLDIYVVFNKAISIQFNVSNYPCIELFLPYQTNVNLLAKYLSGNLTKVIYYQYIIPVADDIRLDNHPFLRLDYAGVLALYNNTNGSIYYEYSPWTNNTLANKADIYLPPADHSYLYYQRFIYINFTIPSISNIYFMNASNTYTAGDYLYVAIEFTQPVIMINPPVLRLYTTASEQISNYISPYHKNASATYYSGNSSNTLLFKYIVGLYDYTKQLDYIDTRYDPYNLSTYDVSFPLNADLSYYNKGRLLFRQYSTHQYEDIVINSDYYGGIYRATDIFTSSKVLANTYLPLPGTLGSLSFNLTIVIDTSAPVVTRVFTYLQSGTYSNLNNISVIVQFNYPVVISGCPTLFFKINKFGRYATYLSGSGTNQIVFNLPIYSSDNIDYFDYYDSNSLVLDSCNDSQNIESIYNRYNTSIYIKRLSLNPLIYANLTLPIPNYKPTIISYTSIRASGIYISIISSNNNQDQSIYRISYIYTSLSRNRNYSIGDVITVYVTFTTDVSIPDGTYLALNDIIIHFIYMYNSSTAAFLYPIQLEDYSKGLTYLRIDALSTNNLSCQITKSVSSNCISQTLPQPYSSSDLLTSKNIKIDSIKPTVNAVCMYSNIIIFGKDNSNGNIYGIPKSFPNYLDISTKLTINLLGDVSKYLSTISNTKTSTTFACDPFGNSYFYKEIIDEANNLRVIYFTGCPNHIYDTSYVNIPQMKENVLYLPLYPIILPIESSTDILCRNSSIGIALNGVPIYSQAVNSSCIDTSLIYYDECGGQSDSYGNYFYNNLPICLTAQRNYVIDQYNRSTQVGWAIDGFPIYSSTGPYGIHMLPCSSNLSDSTYCLDECYGFYGELLDFDLFLYRYFLPTPPALGGCEEVISSGICDLSYNKTFLHACCLYTTDSNQNDISTYSLPCLRGCTSDKFEVCSSSDSESGYTITYKYSDKLSSKISGIYNTSYSSTDFYYNSFKSDPQNYLPTYWDIFVPVSNTDMVANLGSLINFTVSFNEAVEVIGKPGVYLELSNTLVLASFQYQLNEYNLVFEYVIDEFLGTLSIGCSYQTILDVFDGQIVKKSNYLSIIQSNLTIAPICCQNNCLSMNIQSNYPTVNRVYSDYTGSYTVGDYIFIFVEFTAPVIVEGSIYLQLSLSNKPIANYLFNHNSSTLKFLYIVDGIDTTSALEASTMIIDEYSSYYAGILMAGVYSRIKVDVTLPKPGSVNSLGRQSRIIIDRYLNKIINVTTSSTLVTSGDDVYIYLTYKKDITITKLDCVSLNIIIVAVNQTFYVRSAGIYSYNKNQITFLYSVLLLDPTGYLYLSNQTPLNYNQCNIITASDLSNTSMFISPLIVSTPLTFINTTVPTIIRVYIMNQSDVTLGYGDVIHIYIETSLPVSVNNNPQLRLLFFNKTSYANYIGTYNKSLTILPFEYTIEIGDYAQPLVYDGTSALVFGSINRYANPLSILPADRTLPDPYSSNGLSAYNFKIDSQVPYIKYLVPLKRSGVYGPNETIVILARFSGSVEVIGSPLLILQTSDNKTGNAYYVESSVFIDRYQDVLIEILDTDVLFEYIVQVDDNTASLHHNGSDSFVLPLGSQIRHKTTYSFITADISLRNPSDFSIEKGEIVRQWKYRFPAKVEIYLRDLFHTDVNSLDISLRHSTGYISVFNSNTNFGRKFGKPYPRSRLQTNYTAIASDTAIGYNYLFSDTLSNNLALSGVATQSSTLYSPSYAIDGVLDPLLSDYSVSETAIEDNSWWLLQFSNIQIIRSISIYSRQPELWIPAIVSFTIKGLDKYPQGSCRLNISNFDSSSSSAFGLSSYISYSAASDQVKRAIESVAGVGNVNVNRTLLPVCGIYLSSGCGDGVEHGYGYTYYISFLTTTSTPIIEIVDKQFAGGVVIDGAIGEGSTYLTSYLVTHVDIVRSGYYTASSFDVIYPKGINGSRVGDRSNIWLTPFYVMIFNSTPPTNLSNSLLSATWYQKYSSIDKVLHINLPTNYTVNYLKIQRTTYGSLSLTEVQVFRDRINTIGLYDKGSPISPSSLMTPYQAEESFIAFREIFYDGRWDLEIVQSSISTPTNLAIDKISGAYGMISDYVIIITDLVGQVYVFYQDLTSTITSLPKYGTLYKSESSTPSPYGNWREAFEITKAGQITSKPGLSRNLGLCIEPTNGECIANYGVGSNLDTLRILGDTPNNNFIKFERVVYYKPFDSYLGPDYFTYQIYDGVTLQTHDGLAIDSSNGIVITNEVTVHTRYCRIFGYKLANNITNTPLPLCICAQNESSVLGYSSQCDSVRNEICSNTTTRSQYLSMCQACEISLVSTECIQQTIRSVSFLTTIGECSTYPIMDCSSESVTLSGKDATNYLTISPPTKYGSFTVLGNSFGGYGWFDSSPYPN